MGRCLGFLGRSFSDLRSSSWSKSISDFCLDIGPGFLDDGLGFLSSSVREFCDVSISFWSLEMCAAGFLLQSTKLARLA